MTISRSSTLDQTIGSLTPGTVHIDMAGPDGVMRSTTTSMSSLMAQMDLGDGMNPMSLLQTIAGGDLALRSGDGAPVAGPLGVCDSGREMSRMLVGDGPLAEVVTDLIHVSRASVNDSARSAILEEFASHILAHPHLKKQLAMNKTVHYSLFMAGVHSRSSRVQLRLAFVLELLSGRTKATDIASFVRSESMLTRMWSFGQQLA